MSSTETAGLSPLHLGPVFDAELFEVIDRRAQINYESTRGNKNPQRNEPRRNPWRRAFNIRPRIRAVMKKMVMRTRSMIPRFGSLRKPRRQFNPSETPVENLIEQNSESDVISSAADQQPESSVQQDECGNKGLITTSPLPNTPSQCSQETIIDIEESVSTDEQEEVDYDDTPRRYIHRMPHEEEWPAFEIGLVKKLAIWLEPKLTTPLESCVDVVSEILSSSD